MLVWEEDLIADKEDSTARRNARARERYEKNLKKAGLEMEEVRNYNIFL